MYFQFHLAHYPSWNTLQFSWMFFDGARAFVFSKKLRHNRKMVSSLQNVPNYESSNICKLDTDTLSSPCSNFQQITTMQCWFQKVFVFKIMDVFSWGSILRIPISHCSSLRWLLFYKTLYRMLCSFVAIWNVLRCCYGDSIISIGNSQSFKF